MKKLKNWIKAHSSIKDFLEKTKISRTHFYEWCRGEKRISLQIASKIVEYTNNEIPYSDLVAFEKSFDETNDKN